MVDIRCNSILGIFFFGGICFFVAGFPSAQAGVRVQQANISYLGSSALPVPTGSCDSASQNDGPPGLSYNPAGNGGAGSFMISGPAPSVCLAEIAIPTVGSTPATLQAWRYDVLGGAQNNLSPGGVCTNGCFVGGHIIYNNTLYINTFAYYADPPNSNALFTHSTTLSSSAGQTGPSTIGNTGSWQRALGGWMDQIPAEHQALLGGTHVTGYGFTSVINNSSFGPALAVLTPGSSSAPTWLMRYDGNDESRHMIWTGNAEFPACTGPGNRCTWSSQNGPSGQALANGTTKVGGITFIEGSDTVLAAMSSGTGQVCYKEGCSQAQMNNGCSLPAAGHSAAPTKYIFMLFDVDDLAAARNGTINPWDVTPYAAFSVATWDTWPSSCSTDFHIHGVQFIRDTPTSSTGKLYVYRSRNNSGQAHTPTMHIYSVSGLSSGAPDPTPPTSPTSLAASATSSSSISVSWTASTDNVGVTGYIVERCQGTGCSNFTQVGTPSASPFVDSGLTASTFYNYHVRAVDAAGNLSGWSNVVGATTQAPDTQAPTAPTNLQATASSSSTINLTWTASTDNVAVTSYQVERCSGASCVNFAQVGTPSTNSFSDSGLSASTLYRYQVRAVDAAGNNSSYSTIAQATTASAPPFAFVQGAASTDTTTAAFSTTNTAGNTIIAAISWGNNATPTCSDSQGNTYTVATNTYDGTNNQSLGVCYATNIRAGANNFTLNVGGAGSTRILIHEYSGIEQTSPVDVTKTNIANATTASNNVTSTAATTTQNNNLIFGAVMDDTGTTSITAGTNFIQRQSVNGKDLVSQDYLQPTAGSIASTQTFGTTHRYLAHMVAFKTVGGPGGGDSTPPTISLTAPAQGSTVSGTSVTVSADATDNIGVTGVQFQLDGSPLGSEDTSSPYSLTWDTTQTTNSTHTLTAIARDQAGNTTTSASRTVTVSNTDPTPPTILSLTSSPSSGSFTVGSTMTLTTTFSEAVTSTGNVTLTLETGTTDRSCSFTITNSSSASCTYSVQAGDTSADLTTNAITGTIRDQAGNLLTNFTPGTTLAQSSSLIIDTTAPSVFITTPTEGSTVSGLQTLSATASDTNGIAGVQFKLDGSNLGSEDLSSPYSLAWNTALTTNASHLLTATARDAAGNILTSSAITVTVSNGGDITPPSLTQVTPIPSVTRDSTPDYAFSSTEGGTLSLSGGCTTPTTSVSAGNTTLTLSPLTPATYPSCSLRVTDAASNQSSPLSIPSFTLTLSGDLNLDRSVNVLDFSLLKSSYGTTNPQGDVNQDGAVNVLDFGILKAEYGQSV